MPPQKNHKMFAPVSICPWEKRFFAGHAVKLNSFPLQANLCASLSSCLSVCTLSPASGRDVKRLQTLQNLAPWCKSRAIYFLTVQHRDLFWGWLSFKTEIQGMLPCGLSFILTQLDVFQGWWASGLWATLHSSDSHTGVKGHLCWVRCYFQGDRHIYTLAQPILFWISYKYSAAAISLSSENLNFFFFFSFYFLPLRCKLFLIFVSCEWKLKKK